GWRRDDLGALLDMLAEGTLTPGILQGFGLAGIRSAEALLQDRTVVGKVVVTPWAEHPRPATSAVSCLPVRASTRIASRSGKARCTSATGSSPAACENWPGLCGTTA